ncbi:hypothetical protein F5Y10DRAFT_244075 [Nemania abortiva]|nr:hypothetical protein F5Y10DRAFT_244075 [Nemania abortiva]
MLRSNYTYTSLNTALNTATSHLVLVVAALCLFYRFAALFDCKAEVKSYQAQTIVQLVKWFLSKLQFGGPCNTASRRS